MDNLYILLFVFSVSILLLVFHIYWLLGGNFGLVFTNYLVSKKSKKSKSIKKNQILIVTFLLTFVFVVNLTQTGLYVIIDDSEIIFWANRAISVGFLYRAIGNFRQFGFTKTIKKGNYASLDSWVYSPVFLLMAISQFLLSMLD